ncbi:MAG: RNA-binding protein [Lachnospiraceae bacterium]|nr:RNA-binding protein [Lachnospiraceae bacterium]
MGLRLGEVQTLTIRKETSFGVYLGEDGNEGEQVLLPAKEVPEGAAPGSTLSVFLYLDSEDRPIATTAEPLLTMYAPAALTVKEVTKIGAFLSWGLPKDLFLPYKEMTEKVREGETVLVRLYLDKSGRLAASMKKLYALLSVKAPYRAGDEVQGRIYEFGHDFGTFVAVDDRYSAMIPRHEDVGGLRIGTVVTARVTNVKEDGKLDLTLREKAYAQLDADGERILSLLDSYGGVLPFTEAADPEVIRRETGLSKAAFKRAVGRLYKERRITITEHRIRKA